MSKSSSSGEIITSTASNQNVIVLDLTSTASTTASSTVTSATSVAPSKPALGNNVLSDILQMTGIMNNDIDEDDDNNQQQQQQPERSTTTLQKGSYWELKLNLGPL